MLSCNIGPQNRLMRGMTGIVVNFLVVLFSAAIPLWLFWLGIVVSYAILFQGVVGWCYVHALLGTKNLK
ncbi:MAG: DUF2892 domain-containing protein [Candidatus Abawacabacteria bacterium]|nr:DUF2892 domain-containing protein [Candidatus Abawacabacteria bacterium]